MFPQVSGCFPRSLDLHRGHALRADEVHWGGGQRQHHQPQLRGERGGHRHRRLGHDLQPGHPHPHGRQRRKEHGIIDELKVKAEQLGFFRSPGAAVSPAPPPRFAIKLCPQVLLGWVGGEKKRRLGLKMSRALPRTGGK